LLFWRQNSPVCHIGQFIDSLLDLIVRSDRSDFPRCVDCEAFSKWFDEPIKDGGTHGGEYAKALFVQQQ